MGFRLFALLSRSSLRHESVLSPLLSPLKINPPPITTSLALPRASCTPRPRTVCRPQTNPTNPTTRMSGGGCHQSCLHRNAGAGHRGADHEPQTNLRQAPIRQPALRSASLAPRLSFGLRRGEGSWQPRALLVPEKPPKKKQNQMP